MEAPSTKASGVSGSHKTLRVDIDALQSAMQKLCQQNQDDEGFTYRDIMEELGCSETTAGRRIRKLVGAGLAVRSGRRMIKKVDGTNYPTPTYKLVEE